MSLFKIALPPDHAARFLALMLVAWQPFVSGGRLPSLLLAVLGIWMLSQRRIDIACTPVRRLGIIFLLLAVPAAISLPGSFHPIGTLNVVLVLCLFFIAGLAVLRGVKTEADHSWLQRWLAIVLVTWVVDGIIQFAFGTDLLGVSVPKGEAIQGPFAGNLHLSTFVTVLMPVMLWRMAKVRPWVALAIMPLVGIIAVLSGARSSMLYFIFASLTLVPRFSWRQRAVMVVGVVTALTLAVLHSPAATERMNRLVNLEGESSLFQTLDRVLSGRMVIWETGMKMLKDRPLTGVGTSAFAEAYDHYATRPNDPFRSGGGYAGGVYHAHQMYVSVAAESGLVGLLGLVAAVMLGIIWYWRAPAEQRALAAPYATSLAVIAFPLQSQPVLYTIWWFPIIWLLVCAMLAALHPETKFSDPIIRPLQHTDTA